MRLAPLLSATALALVAAGALAQGAGQPVDNGLNGLSETLNGLSDNGQTETPPPAGAPEQNVAEPATPAPAEPPAEAPAAAETPAGTPARTGQEAAAPPAPPPPAPPPSRPRIVMPPEPLTRAQLAELRAAATRGRLLGVIERSGRMATQDMLSRVPDPNAAGISGWIAEAEGNGVAVTFYADGDANSGPVIVYRVTINGGRIVDRDIHLTGTRPPLNPLQARMAAARAATAALPNQPCGSEVFNVFVVPPLTADGVIDVYQISPQTRPGFYPLGGHFRTSIAPDGSVAGTRGYTSTCLDAAVAVPAPGTRPAPVSVTHLLDPLPQDIHVFLSAWTGHPLLVVAGDPQRIFVATPDGIAEVPREGAGR
jgi:hypothetical protein